MKTICTHLFLVALFVSPLHADEVTPAKVPFEILRSKHLAVQIKVNGKGPYRVIFDTGAPVNLLSNKVAREAGLTQGRGAFPALFGMQGQLKVKSLEVGDLKSENTSVVVMDHPTINAVAKVLGPLEGIIGFPFFSQYRMTLDYQSSTMTFVPVDYRAPDVMDAMMTAMLNQDKKPVRKIHAPATVWGFTVAKEKGDQETGVEIVEVLPFSPAAEAGLKMGDRLLTLDGTWTESVTDCHRAAANVEAGQEVRVELMRKGKELRRMITPRAGL